MKNDRSGFNLAIILSLALASGRPATASPYPRFDAQDNRDQQQSYARLQSQTPTQSTAPHHSHAPHKEPRFIANRLNFSDTPNPTSEPTKTVTVKPLTKEQLNKLLNTRLDSGMSNSFERFANKFVVVSTLCLPNLVGLVTDSNEIENTELESPFPPSYKATMREFLDAIALQTHSKWQYDPTGKFIRSQTKNSKPVTNTAMFEFIKTERERPYLITPANRWQFEDHGNWVMGKPPTAPVGMDIYELGSYSCDDKTKTKELLQRIPYDIALEWAQRVKPEATTKELKHAKVGEYDAVLFEATLKSKAGPEVHWRHWVFMAGNHCYLFLSTIFPDKEETILPDVEAMLKSFRPLQEQPGKQ